MGNHHVKDENMPRTGSNNQQYSDLEVCTPAYSQLPEATSSFLHPASPEKDTGKIVKGNADGDTEKIAYNNNGEKFIMGGKRFNISRRKLYLGIAIGTVIVIAALVGAVLGVMKRKDRSPSTDIPGNNEEDMTGNLVWNQSSLAVTGWRYNDEKEFSMRLFYQDAEGYLRISAMESTSKESWTQGTRFVKAKQGTPLAASCNNQSIYEPEKSAMETHVFYLDEEHILREYVFRDNSDTGFSGSLNAQNITPADDTRLASYWPFVTYQNADNTFSEVRYNCTKSSTINCWSANNLQIAGPGPSAALAMVPGGRQLNGMWLFFQREDGELVNSAWVNKTDIWSGRDFSHPIPRSQPAAVFVMPRSPDSNDLNFHVLYQESDDNDISWIWKREDEWDEKKKDPALEDAMRGTSIACLTQASWWDKKLTHDQDMSRCYFFGKGGQLRSVHRVRSTWYDLGIVKGVGKR